MARQVLVRIGYQPARPLILAQAFDSLPKTVPFTVEPAIELRTDILQSLEQFAAAYGGKIRRTGRSRFHQRQGVHPTGRYVEPNRCPPRRDQFRRERPQGGTQLAQCLTAARSGLLVVCAIPQHRGETRAGNLRSKREAEIRQHGSAFLAARKDVVAEVARRSHCPKKVDASDRMSRPLLGAVANPRLHGSRLTGDNRDLGVPHSLELHRLRACSHSAGTKLLEIVGALNTAKHVFDFDRMATSVPESGSPANIGLKSVQQYYFWGVIVTRVGTQKLVEIATPQ